MLGKKIVIVILIFLIIIVALKIKYQFNENFSNKELKFIHITKNAGTFIEDIAKRKNILFGRFHGEYGYWHHFFPNVDENIKNKYDWFMVVRNPYDRIISEYYCNWNGVGDTIHNKKEFNKYIIDKINNRSTVGDHYSEQYKYLDDNHKIHIIKYENLNNELYSLFKQYNLDIDLSNEKINKPKKDKKFTPKDFDENVISLINNVYHNDFEKFGYTKM